MSAFWGHVINLNDRSDVCYVSPDLVSADTALRLGHWFGTSAEFWLNLQKSYELRLAQRESGSEIKRLPRRAA